MIVREAPWLTQVEFPVDQTTLNTLGKELGFAQSAGLDTNSRADGEDCWKKVDRGG